MTICYLLPSLYAAAFVRRTTSSTDLHPFFKRRLYLIRFNRFIVYTGCGTVVNKKEEKNVITHALYFHIYILMHAHIEIYIRLRTKTHPSMRIIVVKSKTHPSMHIIVLKSKTYRCGKI